MGLLLKVVVALGVRNLTPLAGTAEPGGLGGGGGTPLPNFKEKIIKIINLKKKTDRKLQ